MRRACVVFYIQGVESTIVLISILKKYIFLKAKEQKAKK